MRRPSEDRCTAIVCGSHHGQPVGVDWGWCHNALDAFDREQRIGHLIQGGADGIDKLAAGWARSRRRIWTTVEADWDQYKRAAGPIRNAKQLALLIRITEAAQRVVLAFPGGDGTEDMVRIAKEAHVPVWRCAIVGSVGFDWMEDR